jgi:hypothetical protein
MYQWAASARRIARLALAIARVPKNATVAMAQSATST